MFREFFDKYVTRHVDHIEIIYVAIGSASCLLEKRIDDLKMEDRQQFPPFMQKIHRDNPNLRITLVLIDPMLTDPPYCVERQLDCKRVSDYHYSSETINVYAFRESCSYYDGDYGQDIRPSFRKLITYCQNNPVIAFVHAFSGREMSDLRENLMGKNPYLQEKIMFGIDFGQDGGCYIDLMNPTNHPLLESDGGQYTIFNPSSIPNTSLVSMYHCTDNNIKRMQIKRVIDNIYLSFKTTISTYRMVKYQSEHKDGNERSLKYSLSRIDRLYGTNTLGLYDTGDFGNIMGQLIGCIKANLYNVFDTFLGPSESPRIVENLINQLLEIEDIYKYEDIVKGYFSSVYSVSMEEGAMSSRKLSNRRSNGRGKVKAGAGAREDEEGGADEHKDDF